MRIGYCSPFNPMRSGISDFSEELVMALRPLVDVIIFSPVPPDNALINQQFEVHLLSELDNEALRTSLDLIVYHIGNNAQYHSEIVSMFFKYPGIVELHEVGLHHFMAAETCAKGDMNGYLELARYCHGERGFKIAQAFARGEAPAPWDTHSLDMSMNKHIIDSASAIIVHSDMVKQMVLGVRPEIPIINIMHHSMAIDIAPVAWTAQCRNQLDLPLEQIIFGSFGYAAKTKRIIPILDAVQQYKEKKREDFLYLIVGEAEAGMNVQDAIQSRGLEKQVKVTGFTSLEDFKTYMGACDFCINLRYPTQGESSGSLHRMMGMGKPVIVTDIGTFGDYPDVFTYKVRYDAHEVEDIYNAISTFTEEKTELIKRGEEAIRFVRENCSLRTNAKAYASFFQSITWRIWQPDYSDVLVSRLCEAGLTGEKYLNHFAEQLGPMLDICMRSKE